VPEGAKRHFFPKLIYLHTFIQFFSIFILKKNLNLNFAFLYLNNKTHLYHLKNHYFLGGKKVPFAKWHLLAPTECTDCGSFEAQEGAIWQMEPSSSQS